MNNKIMIGVTKQHLGYQNRLSSVFLYEQIWGGIHPGIALANAITSLLRNDTALDEMARNIQNDYFVGDKSWKVIAEKYIEFYKKIL